MSSPNPASPLCATAGVYPGDAKGRGPARCPGSRAYPSPPRGTGGGRIENTQERTTMTTVSARTAIAVLLAVTPAPACACNGPKPTGQSPDPQPQPGPQPQPQSQPQPQPDREPATGQGPDEENERNDNGPAATTPPAQTTALCVLDHRGAPATVCGLQLYAIDAAGHGSFVLTLPALTNWQTIAQHVGSDPLLDMHTTHNGQAFSIYYLPAGNRYSIHTHYPDGKPYVFELDADGAIHIVTW